ncbi:MAG: nickel pincer cofactor biosynthesis protein LarC, partial [Armatimonadota bacterium]
MKKAYLEAVGGLSGDMMLGALVGAGLPLEALTETIEMLGLSDEVRVSARSLRKCGIAATKVDVEKIGHHHHHEGDLDEHEHHEHSHGRSAQELIEVIEAAGGLDDGVRERSVGIIRRLAEAEAKIHDSTPEEVHFHELGGLDTIVDVVGAVEGLRRLGVGELHVSPLPIGHGWINCAHGRLPVPAPATAELLHGVPTTSVDIEGETVTPTGAALAAVLADDFGRPDGFISGAVGYGCGDADFDPVPNIVRLTLSRREEEARSDEARLVTVIEANIDDMTGELIPNAIDRALEAGALDCWSAPIVMKKGRPALLLRAICEPGRAEEVASVILRETTTLGVRMTQMQR